MRILFSFFAVSFLPGLPLDALGLTRRLPGIGGIAVAGVLGLLWTTLWSLGLTAIGIPLTVPVLALALAVPAMVAILWRRSLARMRTLWPGLLPALVVVVLAAALAYPFVAVQRQLPTGDIQKALFFADRIRATDRLPDYQEALRFNRDPGDFAIPGLHALTAAVSVLSGDPLRGPGWFSLFAAVLLAGMAPALVQTLTSHTSRLTPLLAFVLAAASPRFLRYTAAPGYHYQNLIGELFLLLAFFFLLRAVGGRGGVGASLAGAALAAAALPLVHQFSAFLGLLLLPAVFLTLLITYRREVGTLLAVSRRARAAASAAAVVLGVGLVFLAGGPLAEKLPHLFTATPHLRSAVIPLPQIPDLLGVPFTALALAGAVVAIVGTLRHTLDWRWRLVLLWTVLLLLLSQGARAFLDIPSARTLFYLVIPLAALAALAVATAVEQLRVLWPRAASLLVPIALALVLAPTAGASMNASLFAIDHSLQANSTLTPATLELVRWLAAHPPACPPPDRSNRSNTSHRSNGSNKAHGATSCPDAILIDDWNRRRTTWAILSPYRLLTRVGADLAPIAREAGQSDQRRRQYENLLDFEMIYALGNQPAVVELFRRHGIAFVVGAKGLSEDVFTANPALKKAYENDEVVLYTPTGSQIPDAGFQRPDVGFQMPERAALANDIGDAEDVFAHVPLSLLAPQISGPQHQGTGDRGQGTGEGGRRTGTTYREVQSAVSSIGLNVWTYVPLLWDQDQNRLVDRSVELQIRALGNGASGRLARGTTVFTEFNLPEDDEWHEIVATIPAGELPIDKQGLSFATIRLDRGPLRVDWMTARLLP